MDIYKEILNEILRDIAEMRRVLGHIEGEMSGICKLPDRVSKLELWQYWLKGAWAALAAAYLCLEAFKR